ncbi:MAG: ATP-dependent helicase [Gammaproteobacteria bacterium]|nr:MAG: ATP-dependent helicase [Gammaproteobacteria bacterium]
MSVDSSTPDSFDELGLSAPVMSAVKKAGYESPSPIQAAIIPLVLQGRDVIGQAQTGTGKTAAFALPILSNIDLKQEKPQVMVLAPTRELAIQVAEAFQTYASGLKGFHVLPIYGGTDFRGQLRQLQRGVHVVVGTPGRVMDHMRRGTLDLSGLKTLVLDEADEMLRMGFIDDVEWILEQTPEQRQIALFSATMPDAIRKIAKKHLNNPEQVTIKQKTTTAANIRQRYMIASGRNKLDALTRILESEPYDGVIIFSRTKTMTVELADRLRARGYAATAINGEIPQAKREKTIHALKKGQLDILIATDVVARGLDVERISLIINYDIPHDTESYVHRIGRTGRAGRSGEAILFVAPREKRLLHAIERATNQKIEPMQMPSTDTINARRIEQFKQKISDTLTNHPEGLVFYRDLIAQYQEDNDVDPLEIAAALAKLNQGNEDLLVSDRPQGRQESFGADRGRPSRHSRRDGRREVSRERSDSRSQGRRHERSRDDRPRRAPARQQQRSGSRQPEAGMERYRIEVGRAHDVQPGNIVGAIANEAGLSSEHIGRITIEEDHSFVDLPEGMPKDIKRDLSKAWVKGRQLKISLAGEGKTGYANKRDKPRKKLHIKSQSGTKKSK